MSPVPAGFLRLLVAGASLALGSVLPDSSPLSAQQPTFRTGVEYIEVDAHVTDRDGKPVSGLLKEHFKVLEDGKEQVLEGFMAIDVPIDVAAPPSQVQIAAAVTIPAETTLEVEFPPASDSRVFVIVLDDRLIDHQRTLKTINLATSFITSFLGPDDVAAVVSTSGRRDASQTFTKDKPKLLKAVQRFMGRKPESIVLVGLQRSNVAGAAAEKKFETLESMRFVQLVVDQMAAIQGRSKALLLVSEGVDMTAGSGPDTRLVLDSEREMIAAATRANVTIHTVDPRGLYAYDELTAYGGSYPAAQAEAARVATAKESGQQAGLRPEMVGGAAMTMAVKAFKDEVLRGQMTLRGVATSTNGLTIVNSNKFEDGFERILAQQSTYYLLSYRPHNSRRAGRFRRIEVKVQGRGFKVTARQGYTEATY